MPWSMNSSAVLSQAQGTARHAAGGPDNVHCIHRPRLATGLCNLLLGQAGAFSSGDTGRGSDESQEPASLAGLQAEIRELARSVQELKQQQEKQARELKQQHEKETRERKLQQEKEARDLRQKQLDKDRAVLLNVNKFDLVTLALLGVGGVCISGGNPDHVLYGALWCGATLWFWAESIEAFEEGYKAAKKKADEEARGEKK